MAPFQRDDMQLIRAALRTKGHLRDLAIFNTGIDSMLRSCDLLRLKVSDVRSETGEMLKEFQILQKKTSREVTCCLTEHTHEALRQLIEAEGKWQGDYLFTPADKPHDDHITEGMLRILVKSWARYAHLDPRRYSGHSLRRTKAAFIYEETRNIEAIRQLLGHRTLQQTSEYLGVETKDALGLAAKYAI